MRKRRRDPADLVGEFGYRHKRREDQCDQHERGFTEHAQGPASWRGCRLRLQARDNPLRQFPLDEERPDFRHAEVAFAAVALAHDAQQDRPFALHQLPIDPTSIIFGAREIRVHVGRDLLGCQPALGSAGWVLPVLPELCETREFRLVHLGSRGEDARTAAMLVQGTIAQRVELRSGPEAAEHAQGVEAVGDQRDQIDLQARQFFLQPLLSGRYLDRLGKLWKGHNVATNETSRNKGAQKRARIIGRNVLHEPQS